MIDFLLSHLLNRFRASLCLIVLYTSYGFAQKNALAIHLDDPSPSFLGVSYQRNISSIIGVSTSLRFLISSYEINPTFLNADSDQGIYSRIHSNGDIRSISTKEGDPFHPNSDYHPIGGSYFNINPNIGLFVEKRNLFIKRLNVRLTSNINIVRENNINEESSYFMILGEDNAGNEYEFEYYHFHYDRFWAKPFISIELQLDYTIYKNMFIGFIYIHNLGNNRSWISEQFGNITIGTRF
jgi:hypothetical protein